MDGTTPLVQVILTQFWLILKTSPLIVATLLLLIRFLSRRYLSPLRKYPGPFLASGTRLYSLYTTWRGDTHEHHIRLHQRYGPIVRLQPNQLSFASPEAARQVLAPGKGFNKTAFYWVFPPYGSPDIFTEIREEEHAAKKRFANQPYSLTSFQALTPWIEETVQLFTDKLDSFCEGGSGTMDLGNYLHYFAFDVLGQVAFSKIFGFVEQGKDVDGAIAFIDTIQVYDGVVGQIPWLDYVLRRAPWWDYLPFVTPMGDNYITRTALGELSARTNGTAKVDRRDLLSMLLEQQEKGSEKFGMDTVFAIAHGAIGAGSDSTASTMQTFMWNVLSQDKVHQRLIDEILEADRNEDLSEITSWEEAQKNLPYFQACLKEAMRIGPAVGLPIYRRVPGVGAEIDGTFVPGGTEVAVNAWVLHRDKDIFAQDANDFRPERWLVDEGLKDDEARVKRMDRYMFQFGGGSHMCIGRNLALLEINKILPTILRRYKFALKYPGSPLKKHSSFFVVQKGLEVSIARRQ